jgi:putative drug exporter of the RND superfamily
MSTVRDGSVRDGSTVRDGDADQPRRRWALPALTIVAFLVFGGGLARVGGQLSEVQRNDSAAYLPRGAEATEASQLSKRFVGSETTTAIVVYERPSGIAEADRVELIFTTLAVADVFDNRLAGPPIGPTVSSDGKGVQVLYHFAGTDPEQIRSHVNALRQLARGPDGMTMHVTGPAGAVTDLVEVFGEVDRTLLLVTGLVILLILVVAYRSPVLPLLVLTAAGLALGMTNGIAYLLAKAGLVTVSGDAQGILGVLVLGAGTDYALLLAARFRDELRRHEDRYEALRAAWRAAVAPILASGATVIFALLCLLASNVESTRGLGPVAAIGIACSLVTMLVLLPALLALTGRVAFWPLFSAAPPQAGFWQRVAGTVGRRPRLVWAVTALALGALALGTVRLEAHGVPRNDSFLAAVDSTAGQDMLARHFPESLGTPAVVIVNADRLDQVLAAARSVSGVAEAEPYLDPLEAYDRRAKGQPAPPPKLVDGLARIEVTFDALTDTPRARDLIGDLRAAVRAVPGANPLVGGYTAATVDTQRSAQRDRRIIIPLVLLIVFLVLGLLLRAVVAALLLIATVIVSFIATLGVSGVVFRDVLGFAGADSSLPLFAFVFLVALGVDYNIFLITRVREEAMTHGHRDGVLRGLALTGGVITSAGVVLAATFAALAVLPLVVLAELAFAVSFGVLLDALIVRTLLVPALAVDVGPRFWWPGPLSRPSGPQ